METQWTCGQAVYMDSDPARLRTRISGRHAETRLPLNLLSPSTALRGPWLTVSAPGESFESTEHSGKWLIYREADSIAPAWRLVLDLVLSGAVACAKVSTRQSALLGWHAQHVICVYTRNWRARKDVMRVRELLRSAGFTDRLQYKRDLDTSRGIERFSYEA
jgi:hypothetical protein